LPRWAGYSYAFFAGSAYAPPAGRSEDPAEEDHRMAAPDIVMYEEEFNQIKQVISKLRVDANAKVVFLVDKNGQQIAAQGEIENLDTTSLASLTAGNVAATDGLARLIGEKEFSILFHEGERDNIHISIVAGRVILVVIFDERSSLGLVRLRVKKASGELNEVFTRIMEKVEKERAEAGAAFESPFAEITDDDIDSLFSE
jgi:predicted regulator of Ras-like GTPase activity (Roadblock/LC7/MglB family)